jgi:hypothetical protein
MHRAAGLHLRYARSRCAVARQYVVCVEQFERGQTRTAGERVAGVRVRVQEAARGVVVVERRVYRIAREHDGQRRVAVADALGQAQESGHTRACSQAKKVPVRAQPAAISSAIQCT